METAAANAHDITAASKLIRLDDEVVSGDSGYIGIEKREEIAENEKLSSVEYRWQSSSDCWQKPDSRPPLLSRTESWDGKVLEPNHC